MEIFKHIINLIASPALLISGTMVLFLIALWSRGIWKPLPAKILLGAAILFLALSYQDPNFHKIATAPDNVPIVGMLFLVGFFVWLGLVATVQLTGALFLAILIARLASVYPPPPLREHRAVEESRTPSFIRRLRERTRTPPPT